MVLQVGEIGANNILTGIDEVGNSLFGDTDQSLTGEQIGGSDRLIGGNNLGVAHLAPANRIFGDAWHILDEARGGDDFLYGGHHSRNWLYGDSDAISATLWESGDDDWIWSSPRGGDDYLKGGDDAWNQLIGDATILERAIAGNDMLVGGFGSFNWMFGDSRGVSDDGPAEISLLQVSGDDILIGGDNSQNRMYGDALYLGRASDGGNDILVGGADATNMMYGDAQDLLNWTSRPWAGIGGDDTLIAGGRSTNFMYGDAYQMHTGTTGGNDRLISGSGNDEMWGDAAFRGGIALWDEGEEEWYDNPPPPNVTRSGEDVFGFMPENGNDTIHDFEQGMDLIELWGFTKTVNTFNGSAIAWTRMSDVAKAKFVNATTWTFDDLLIDVVDGHSVIDTGGGSSVTVRNASALSADDFRFFKESIPSDFTIISTLTSWDMLT